MKKYIFNESLGHRIEYSSKLMANRLNQKFKQENYPVTAEQWAIINCLLKADGVTQNQVAKIVKKDHTCVSRLIDNLIKKNIVKRIPDQQDRRSNLIYLTEEGAELRIELLALLESHLNRALAGIDPADVKVCSSVLDKIIKNLE